jgi:hypothetical protein
VTFVVRNFRCRPRSQSLRLMNRVQLHLYHLEITFFNFTRAANDAETSRLMKKCTCMYPN